MKKKILVMDDDVELCEEMKELLTEEGYFVQTAFDCTEGQKLVDRDIYDIILLDFKMPGLSGIDMLRKIKDKQPDAAVFIVTARPFIDKILEEEKAALFVDGIVKKPIDIEILLARIKTH